MPNKPQRGLGRGLSAILGEEVDVDSLRKPVGYINKEVARGASSHGSSDILKVPANLIEPNPFQPRMTFDEDALRELVESVKTLGLIQPISVRPVGERYQIISGERRFRACQAAGMDLIPAYVLNPDDQGMLEMAIVENVQRKDLDPIEVALGYDRLLTECGLTQEKLAERLGKSRVSVTNTLRLLRLPAKVQHDLKVGLISVGHAKVLLGVEDPAYQEFLCDIIIRDGLSVRQTEERIKRGEAAKKVEAALPELCNKVLESVGRYFPSAKIRRSPSGKGTITIHFNDDRELEDFLGILEK